MMVHSSLVARVVILIIKIPVALEVMNPLKGKGVKKRSNGLKCPPGIVARTKGKLHRSK